MAKDALQQLEQDLKKQCLLLFSDPETDLPIFIDLFDAPPKRGALNVISMAERYVSRPWTRRIQQIMATGRLPDVTVLADDLDPSIMTQWAPYIHELSLRLAEEPGGTIEETASDSLVFTPEDGSEILVDQDQFDEISQHRWRLRNPESESSVVLHVCREFGIECSCSSTSLHRFVADAQTDQIVWHRKSSYDNTRSNLLRCCLKPSRKRRDEILQRIKIMIEERSHRRGRPKKRHEWRTIEDPI